MKRRELNQLKLDAYKNFIQMQYGNEALDRLEIAIKREVTDKALEYRSKDFDRKIDKIDENMQFS